MVSEELKERRCEECFHYEACRRLVDGKMEDLLPCYLFLQKARLYCLVRPCEKCRWWSEPISDELLEACKRCEPSEIKVFDVKELSAYYEIEVYETKEEAEKALKDHKEQPASF